MPVGPFLSHDTGFKTLLGTGNWTTASAYYAVLATHTEVPNRATQIDYEDILAECADADYTRPAITDAAVAVNDTKVRFTCSKIQFTASGSVTGRYLYILKGTAAAPDNSDEILGHIDLDGSGNLSSINAEFSLTPDATGGLFRIPRTAGV
jgi:hypothetical protein